MPDCGLSFHVASLLMCASFIPVQTPFRDVSEPLMLFSIVLLNGPGARSTRSRDSLSCLSPLEITMVSSATSITLYGPVAA